MIVNPQLQRWLLNLPLLHAPCCRLPVSSTNTSLHRAEPWLQAPGSSRTIPLIGQSPGCRLPAAAESLLYTLQPLNRAASSSSTNTSPHKAEPCLQAPSSSTDIAVTRCGSICRLPVSSTNMSPHKAEPCLQAPSSSTNTSVEHCGPVHRLLEAAQALHLTRHSAACRLPVAALQPQRHLRPRRRRRRAGPSQAQAVKRRGGSSAGACNAFLWNYMQVRSCSSAASVSLGCVKLHSLSSFCCTP